MVTLVFCVIQTQSLLKFVKTGLQTIQNEWAWWTIPVTPHEVYLVGLQRDLRSITVADQSVTVTNVVVTSYDSESLSQSTGTTASHVRGSDKPEWVSLVGVPLRHSVKCI